MKVTRIDTLAGLIVTTLGILSLAYWWPRFADISRFAFLCCFPAIFPFVYAVIRSTPSFPDRRVRRIVSMMLGIHLVLFVTLLVLSRVFPSRVSIRNPDLVFGFMATEVTAMILIGRLNGTSLR